MLHSDSMIVQGASTSQDDKTAAVPAADPDTSIFVDCWQGKAGAGKVLFIVHGLGEHGGRYKHLSESLGSEFERFYSMDLRGHGRSSGQRGYSPSLDIFIDDIKRVVDEIKRRERDAKIYLLAHSFGGLIALRMLLKEPTVPFAGAIVSSPLLGISLKVPPIKQALSEFLSRTLSRVQFTNEINPSYLSHDPAVIEAYVKDRLVHRKITPKLYIEMCGGMDWVTKQTGPLACPTLFVVAGQDRIVDGAVTVEFAHKLKGPDVELKRYDDFYHEVLNESGKDKVFEDIRKWLEKPVTAKKQKNSGRS